VSSPAAREVGLSTRGRCLLAGGAATAACAVLLDERDLLRIGTFAALLPLLALLLVLAARRALRAERTLVPPRLSLDRAAAVELRVSATTPLGAMLRALLGTLRLTDGVPDAAGPDPDAPPRFLVSRLRAREGLRLSYPLRPAQRGVHRIGPLHARATDPLGLAAVSRELAGTDRLVVLPRVVPLRGLPAAHGGGEGTAGTAPAQQGKGVSDVLVRPYRHGDELRRVHWRSTARHDELMVRLEERPWRGGTTVLLDRRDAAHRGHGPGASIEFAISLAASIGVHLYGRGEPVTLLTEDGAELTDRGPGGGSDALLDALAAVRPSAQRELTGLPGRPETGLIAVLGALGPGDLEVLVAGRAGGGLAVLLDAATWAPAGGTAPDPADVPAAASALRRAGWLVAVAAAGASPAVVWAELTRTDRAAGVR
jgi:uncharacterized protein (DUF58 family)